MSSALEIRDKQIVAAEGKLKARQHFESIFPLLVEEIVEYLDKLHLPEIAVEWFKEVNSSNCPRQACFAYDDHLCGIRGWPLLELEL
jgi:hypothetical protein